MLYSDSSKFASKLATTYEVEFWRQEMCAASFPLFYVHFLAKSTSDEGVVHTSSLSDVHSVVYVNNYVLKREKETMQLHHPHGNLRTRAVLHTGAV